MFDFVLKVLNFFQNLFWFSSWIFCISGIFTILQERSHHHQNNHQNIITIMMKTSIAESILNDWKGWIGRRHLSSQPTTHTFRWLIDYDKFWSDLYYNGSIGTLRDLNSALPVSIPSDSLQKMGLNWCRPGFWRSWAPCSITTSGKASPSCGTSLLMRGMGTRRIWLPMPCSTIQRRLDLILEWSVH